MNKVLNNSWISCVKTPIDLSLYIMTQVMSLPLIRKTLHAMEMPHSLCAFPLYETFLNPKPLNFIHYVGNQLWSKRVCVHARGFVLEIARERERESAQVRQGREAKRKAMQDAKATPAEEEAVDQLRAALLHPHGTALERRQRLLAAWTSLRNSVVPNSQPQGKAPQHIDSWTSQHPKQMRLKP